MRFFSFLFRAAGLSDAKKEALAKKYGIPAEQVETISESDPSPNRMYTDWMLRELKGDSTADLTKLKDALEKFTRAKNNPQFSDSKDILSYTAQQLVDKFSRKQRHQLKDLSQSEVERILKTQGLPGAKLIWNKTPFKVWYVIKPEYAVFLGSNTNWCTTQSGQAKSYCDAGGLWIVYENDKPFAQGHITTNGNSITFLNTKDRGFAPTDENFVDFLEMLSQVRVPDFNQFRRHYHDVLSKMVGGTVLSDPKIQKAVQQIILESDNVNLLSSYLKKNFWEEGWDLLLDFGSVPKLRDVLEDAVAPIWDRIKVNKELSEDILSVLKTDIRARDIDYFAVFDRFDEYVKAGAVGTSGDQIVVDAGMKAIGDLTEEDPAYPPVLARTNSDLLFAYWKKFITKPWPQYAYILKKYPEYAETEEATGDQVAGLPELRLGDKVEPGPTWPRWIKDLKHEIVITGVTGWLVSVEGISESGAKHKASVRYGTDPDSGKVFQDIKLPDDVAKERTKKKAPIYPEKLEIGQRVKRGPTWQWDDQDCDDHAVPSIGTVKEASRFFQPVWYEVEWDAHPDSQNGYPYGPGGEREPGRFYLDIVPV